MDDNTIEVEFPVDATIDDVTSKIRSGTVVIPDRKPIEIHGDTVVGIIKKEDKNG